MRKTTGEANDQIKKTFSYEPLHMDVPVIVDQQELISISSLWTQDVVWKKCREGWMIGINKVKKSQENLC